MHDLFDPGPEPIRISDMEVARAETAAGQLRAHLAELGFDSNTRTTVLAHALIREAGMATGANRAIRIASHARLGRDIAEAAIAEGQPQRWRDLIRLSRQRAGQTSSLAFMVRETVIANLLRAALERWVAEGRTQ